MSMRFSNSVIDQKVRFMKKNCVTCGNEFSAWNRLSKTCSKACREKERNKRKKASGKWGSRYARARKKVIGRVSACESCGFSNRLALHVHHINNASRNHAIDNLMVLCANCHYTYHGTVGFSEKTESMSREYVLGILATPPTPESNSKPSPQ